MIIPIDGEKAINKIQDPFMILKKKGSTNWVYKES